MEEPYGIILGGMIDDIKRSYAMWERQPVDWNLGNEPDPADRFQTTIGRKVSVTGPGTFLGKASRTLTLEPTSASGWWFERKDVQESLPIRVSIRNVWTTARNIVLRSGSPHNYMRMVEHIIALKLGMGLDNLVIRTDSGDPPLFDRGSMDLVEAVEEAGIVEQKEPVSYVTVSERVTLGGPSGSFLTLIPWESGSPGLFMDCATDFPNAFGKQRIQFFLNREWFRYGALARTNTNAAMLFYSRTIGRLFADIRNLGYTNENILIAGKRRYINEPKLIHDGKSLEAVWHRATLDLLAAIALIDQGRFIGKVVSYKAGHSLDVAMINLVHKYNLIRDVTF